LIANKRAFVYAIGLRPFGEKRQGDLDGPFFWRFRPRWMNSGDTPTKNMQIYTACELRNSTLPVNFDFTQMASPAGTGLIGPRNEQLGSLAPAPPNAAITPQDVIDVQRGTKFLYLWGWILYFDVFTNTPQHITRFCWMISPVGDPMTSDLNGLRFDWIYNPQGNCADEECNIIRSRA
jgi:hypothetical protein